MMITLKIDTAAVMTLFPEGSEARVELQSAVIANICKAVGKASGADPVLIAAARKAASDAGRVAMAEYLQGGRGGLLRFEGDIGNSQLASKVQQRVKELIDEQIDTHISRAATGNIEEQYRSSMADAQKRIDDAVARGIEKYTESHIQKCVEDRFKAAIKLSSI
jgi:hypothetical protein